MLIIDHRKPSAKVKTSQNIGPYFGPNFVLSTCFALEHPDRQIGKPLRTKVHGSQKTVMKLRYTTYIVCTTRPDRGGGKGFAYVIF